MATEPRYPPGFIPRTYEEAYAYARHLGITVEQVHEKIKAAGYVTACRTCGCTVDNKLAKYCGRGNDKDNEHDWKRMLKTEADELAVVKHTWTRDNDPVGILKPASQKIIAVDEILSPPIKVRSLEAVELAEIKLALQQFSTLSTAAEALGIAVRTLQRKVKQHHLDRTERTVAAPTQPAIRTTPGTHEEISSGKSS